jgi:transcriptional regulator NrdR family protein
VELIKKSGEYEVWKDKKDFIIARVTNGVARSLLRTAEVELAKIEEIISSVEATMINHEEIK